MAFFSILQALAPDHLRGRVILFTQILAVLVVPLAAVLSGIVIDRVKNVALVFGVLGVFIVLIILAFFPSPLAHVERFLPEEQHSSSTLKASPAE